MQSLNPFANLGQPSQRDTALDLFSTKETTFPQCVYRAPYICIPPSEGKPGYLYQTCCNHWDCPRCGELRARFEYGRMVEGARELAKTEPLYMLTLTCKGKESVKEAEAAFYDRTHKFLDALRKKAKREGKRLEYAAVTERQKRGHPHLHMITNYLPGDAFSIVDNLNLYAHSVKRVNASLPYEMRYKPSPQDDEDYRQLYSEWLVLEAVNAGLGAQVRAALVDLVEGASRYIAKYLFKNAAGEVWPKGWKRVRYSQGWPKLPQNKATSAFPVLSRADWARVAMLPGKIETGSAAVYENALRHLCMNVTCPAPNAVDLPER